MPKCSRLVMIENSVVSWPPCWVAVEVKAPPTLPCSAPRAHRPPAWSRNAGHLRGHAAKAGAGADDDRVVVGQIVDGGDRGSLVELEVRALATSAARFPARA
jgi:hypothetical protein